jgi:signal transduction histidine kinase
MDERFRPASPISSQLDGCRRAPADAALSLAHDFRNLLQLASSSARIARREMAAKREQRLAAMLEEAIQALDRANILAQRLSSPGSTECRNEDVLLQDIVPDLRTLLSRAIGGRIEFESLVADDLPPVRCDRLQLENVLLNLALNARHAMPRGGTLVIEAVPCPSPHHADCIVLSVSDTGHGMSQDVAAQAFEPFFSTRLLEGGTGLGLFNARAFAESLGGTACLSTKENAGTKVMLHLPVFGPDRCG